MKVRVINKMSDWWGATGTADDEEWDREAFWVRVTLLGKSLLLARINLAAE